jgi:hypothetical protein
MLATTAERPKVIWQVLVNEPVIEMGDVIVLAMLIPPALHMVNRQGSVVIKSATHTSE